MLKNQSLLVATATVFATSLAHAQTTGPSTTTPPYLVPNASVPAGSVSTVSILSSGDSIGGYRMCGTPDGLGAFPGPNNTLELVMNHEFGQTQGIVRAHGSKGAFVSRWSIDPATLTVLSGRDHLQSPSSVHNYDRTLAKWVAGTTAWERFCSGDLAPRAAYYFNGIGTDTRIYLNGEETRPPFTTDGGRVYAHILDGTGVNQSWEVPALGRISWENALASPYAQLKTIVMCDDDSQQSTVYAPPSSPAPSEVYMYVGVKRTSGNQITRAGLVGGDLYGMRVLLNGAIVLAESDTYGFGNATSGFVGSADFGMGRLGDVTNWNHDQLEAQSVAHDVFRLARVEDGSWDPRPGFQNDYYFVTTSSATTNSRLYRLHFNDILNPTTGGRIDILLAGSEGYKMLDNICVDSHGRLVMLEDVGNNTRLGKVWLYNPVTDVLTEVAAADAQYFDAAGAHFLTVDEESSGVIPVFNFLGDGWYLLDVQAHYAIGDTELVEGGQLLALYIDPAL